jgi:cell division protein FtsN
MKDISAYMRWLLALCAIAVLITSHVVFYYAGYYMATREFHTYYMAESLNDRIAASIYTMYGEHDQDTTTLSPEESESSQDMSSEDDILPALSSKEEKSVEEGLGAPDNTFSKTEQSLESPEPDDGRYNAYLIGFGAQRNAERYANRLKRQGFSVSVVSREHTTSPGKNIVWYQVVLGPLPYHELLKKVEDLKYRDKLEGIVIIEHTA